MKRFICRLITIVEILALVSINSMATIAYASNEIADTKTSQDNVNFSATINDSNDTKAEIGSDVKLKLNVSVENTGYLKDIKITLDGNNFELNNDEQTNSKGSYTEVASNADTSLTSSNSTSSDIKAINDNIIELNEINVGESKNIEIPVRFKKGDAISKDEYSKESAINFEAKYVNEKGKEKVIKKSIKQKLEWTVKAEEQISQKLVRYLKYDKNTLISFKVSDGLKDNAIPVTNKEINITSPKINNANPQRVIVTGTDISYTYNNGNITIKKEISPDDNGNYSFNSQDDYMVTYIYDGQENVKNVSTNAKANVTSIKGENITAETSNNDFQVGDEVGKIVELDVSLPEQLQKGYLYTNLNRNDKLNTTFSGSYKINVGFSELTDEISLKENSNKIQKNDGNLIEANVKTSKITVDTNEITKVLGDDGKIVVKDGNGKELGTLNKGLGELKINSDKLSFDISKPKTEGNIVINFEKYIDGNNSYNKEEIKSFTTLKNEVELTSSKDGTGISSKKVTNDVKLVEPSSKATLYVSTNTLSTIVENKNVIFNVVLDTNDISDALYKNPKIKITLPGQVQKIDITDAKVFYDDEITAGSFDVQGNQLTVNLTGLETKYSSSATTNGALIRIVANISLDNLAPSSLEKVKMEYSNELTGENNTLEGDMNVVAPTGFVTTNTVSMDGNSETALENNKTVEIDRDNTSKKAKISAKIVNNVGQDANNVVIVGRIPFEGNKTEDGTDLKTTVSTKLSSPINTDIKEAKVYYSENGEKPLNSDAWKEEFNTNAKSFKIVAPNALAKNTISNFNYEITLPDNLDYEKVATESYGVYYRNEATDGENYNLVQAKNISIVTNKKPEITMDISATDSNEGYAIDNNGKVTQGENIVYKVKINNNGSKDVKNGSLKVVLSTNNKSEVNEQFIEDIFTSNFEKENTISVDEIKAGESKTINVPVKIVGDVSKDLNENNITTSFEFNAPDVKTSNRTYTVQKTEGTVNIYLSTELRGKISKDQNMNVDVFVFNANQEEKKNVEIRVDIPKEMEYVGNDSQYSYDKNKHTISFKTDLNSDNYLNFVYFEIPLKLVSETNKQLSVNATATYNSIETKSNAINFYNASSVSNFSATQSTNLPGDSMLDTDEVEYYININNNSSVDEYVTLNDSIPAELSVKKVMLKLNGEEQEKLATNYVIDTILIPSNTTAKYTIIAGAYNSEKGSSVKFENKPVISVEDGRTININSIALNLKGTKENIINTITNNQNTQTNNSGIEDCRSIYGTIWYDENNNGIKEENEKKISGVRVRLLDNNTKTVAKDFYGNDLMTSTNENGEYVFNNVKTGSYVAVADYDNSEYSVGMYNAIGSTSKESSNFVQTKLAKRDVAASNTIDVSESNVYNQNLALVSNNIFDLSIDNTISKVTVVNSKDKKQNKTYNVDKNMAKIELNTKNVEDTTVLVEYKIKVKNEGKVAGYAKKIEDYLPKGMVFNADLNKDWYVTNDGRAYTSKLANTLINPGETKEVTLILTKKITGENVGNIRNVAEIAEDYNEFGLEDINSTADNKRDGENDIAAADTIILMNAGRTKTAIFGISLGIAVIVAYVVFKLKKDVIDKIISNYDIDN